jgi:hypothetical protein
VEAGYSWSWAASGQTTEIGNVTLEATFSAQQEIREGWLKLSAAEPPAQP